MKKKLIAVSLALVMVSSVAIGLVQTRSAYATAATTSITITKYAGDGVTILSQVTVNASDLETGQVTIGGTTYQCPVQGDGTTHYYTQGPTFDPNNLWDPNETVNLKDKGALEGTALSDLCNLVGGASSADLIQVGAIDGYGNDRFPYANVYNQLSDPTLNARQGKMVICWYNGAPEDGNPGYVPNYSNGMLLAFFAETTNANGQHVFGHQDMHDCLPSTDWHFYYDNSIQYPSTNGVYVKWVSNINIYTGNANDWTVGLYGARSDILTRTWFEDGIASNCHGITTYTDPSGNVWSGMPLWRVCGIVDDTNIHGPGAFNNLLYYDVKVTGADGSSYTFPSSTIAQNNDYILANEENGQPLSADKYPLKLVSKNFTVGGPSIAQITRIDLESISTSPPPGIPPASTAQDWPLQLVGTFTLNLSKADFIAGVSCHGASTWMDVNGDTYSGLPLWMLVARVDDGIDHGPGCFNDALAATSGYQILVTAADGYYQYFDSATVARNNNIIVANQVKLAGTSSFVDLPLTMTGGTPPSQHPAYPLKIVGSATSSGDRVGGVVQIALVGLIATSTTAINIAAIPGVTPPVTGGTPASTIAATAEYTGTVAWSPSATSFAGGTVYTATITLTPLSGYTLTGVAANYFNVAGATTVTNSSDSGVITAVFPGTGGTAPSWDLNGDHVCNIGDVVKIGLKWGLIGAPGWIPEDLNGDGVINIGDVVKVGLHWGQTW